MALLRAIDKDEPVPELKFSTEEIKSGQDVFAMGHPMGMVWSVSRGVISHEDRYARHPYVHSVQTDAAINVGNSGGPLLNMKGEIVGINALIISKSTFVRFLNLSGMFNSPNSFINSLTAWS